MKRRRGGPGPVQAKATMDAEIANHLVGLYMREINRVELITAAKEQALASDIELVSHLEGLELELVGGLGYDYGENARAAGAPSTGQWEKAIVLLTPHRKRRTGGPSPGVGRRPHAERGVSTSGVQGRHRRSDQPKLAERAARHPGITEEDARGRIVALSRDTRALPAAAITVEVTARIIAEEGKPAGEILLGFLQARRSHQLARG